MIKKLFLIVFCLCFVLNTVHAGTVEPVFKQLKDPNLDGEDEEPSTSSIAITPDGKKMFIMDNLGNGATDGYAIFIYDLTTAFDISTMDVTNRTIVNTTGLGDDLGFANGKKIIKFNNDGKKLFLFNDFSSQFHNLAIPYDVASISASTLIPDDGLNYKTAYSEADITSLNGVTFNNDGTKMYLNDGFKNTTDITQVNLSTPFDPSSGTFAFTLNTEDIPDLTANRFTFEIAFDDDGTRLYISEGLNNSTGIPTFIYVYKLSTPFELSSATYVGKSQIVGNGNNVSAVGWTFGNNGMKAYIGTEDANADGDDIIYEYDLTCPYGIVICEGEVATVVGAQAEIAKNVIYQNSSNIFKRFDWLRRNEERINLNNHNIKLNINNPILASLKNNLENSLKNKLEYSFTDIEYNQASLKVKKPSINNSNWSHWSHVDISFGRQGDKLSLKPKEIKTKGLMVGADKLVKNKIFGYAFRYGNDVVNVKSLTEEKLETHSYTLSIYGSIPLKNQSHLNALIGASFLSMDQLDKEVIRGNRNGKQIFTSMNYENESTYTKYDLIPFGKFELGITQFSEYTDFNPSGNSNDIHERLTFRTGNISTGLKFDSILYLDDKTLSRNGFIEYINDFTPDIDHYYKNNADNKTNKETVSAYSSHNIKGNIGFEYMRTDGSTFAINYERYQSLNTSGHIDSLLFKFGFIKKQNINFDAIYDPINNNNTEISYLRNLGNLNLKLKSNYSLFSKIPDYGANIELSGTF